MGPETKEAGAEAKDAPVVKIGNHEVSNEALGAIDAVLPEVPTAQAEEELVSLDDVVRPPVQEAGSDTDKDGAPTDAERPDPLPERPAPRRPIHVEWWADKQGEKTAETIKIQPATSGANAVSHKLDEGARAEQVDYWSTWEASPQPDGGQGAVAMAAAYHQRVAELEKKGEVDKDQEHTVCAIGESGKGLTDFMEHLRTQDAANKTNIAERTKPVLICSTERAEMLQEDAAKREDDSVEIRGADLSDPASLPTPEGTMAILIDGATNRTETYHLLRVDEGSLKAWKADPHERAGGIRDNKEISVLCGPEPTVVIDAETGEAVPYQAHNWMRASHAVAEGKPENFTPQLIGRLAIADTLKPREAQPYSNTALKRKEGTVKGYMQGRDPGYIYNYSPAVPGLVEQATKSVGPNGLVLVGGYMREDPDTYMPKLQLVRQDGVDVTVPALNGKGGVQQAVMIASPLREYITEVEQIQKGVENAAKNDKTVEGATVSSFCNEAGEYGYVLIDRSPAEAPAAEAVVEAVVSSRPEATVDEIVDEARQVLDTKQGRDPGRYIQALEGELEQLLGKDGHPSLTRNYELHQRLAELYNERGLTEAAHRHATEAANLLPIASGAQIEIAKAAMGPAANENEEAEKGNLAEAQAAYERARELSPHNPDVYELGIALAQRLGNIEAEVDARINYLRCAPGQTPQQLVLELGELCQAMQRDYESEAGAEGENRVFKTVVQHNFAPGSEVPYEVIEISAAMAKQMRAADAARAGLNAAQQLLNYQNLDGEEFDAMAAPFRAVWDATCPRNPEDGTLLPREFWPDQPGEHSRWIYAGRITQSDEEAPPTKLFDLDYSGGENSGDVTVQYNKEFIRSADLLLGERVEDGKSIGTMSITVEALKRHVFVSGITGMGKTVLIENMLEQMPKAGANFIVMDLATKNGLSNLVDRLNAKDIPVSRIEVNNPDAIPISIDIMTPVEGCSVTEHIGNILQTWESAYSMPDPFPQILKLALQDVYAQNGWNVMSEEEMSGSVAMHAVLDNPMPPTMQQLQDACLARAAKYVGDAKNIGEFFRTRTKHMMQPDMANFLHSDTSSSIDWDKLLEENVYIDLSHVADENTRRFLAAAFLTKFNEALKHRRGLVGDELKTALVMDEAGLVLEAGSDSPARKEAVDRFANALRTDREYGLGAMMFTQVPSAASPAARSQSGAVISLALNEVTDVEVMGPALGLGDDEKEELRGLNPGQAFVRMSGMTKAVRVDLRMPTSPPEAAVAEARERFVPPPVKGDTSNMYTDGERQHAQQASRADEHAWLRLTVGAVTMSHVTNTVLPSQIPPQLQEQWQQMSATDRRQAELVVRTIVENTVKDRESAVAGAYDPRLLGASVLSIVTGMLDGKEPISSGRFASASFAVPQAVWANTYAGLTMPVAQKPLPDDNFAVPRQGGLTQPSPDMRIEDHRKELWRHPLSPARNRRNAEKAWISILGTRDGMSFWRDMTNATGGEPDIFKQRRIVAVALGLIPDINHPGFSDLEAVLSLPNAIRAQEAGAVAS